MTLGSALSIASSGLSSVQAQIAVVSQNVANANAAGYVEETAAAVEQDAGDQPDGVRAGVATRVETPALQTSLYAQNASVSASSTLSAAFTAMTSVLGSTSSDTGSTGSLTDLLSTLQSGFTTLQSDPTSTTQMQTVVASAGELAQTMNEIAANATTQRQSAADAAVAGVASIDQSLAVIGQTSAAITRMSAAGQSVAGLEDQRQAAMTALSNQLDVTFTPTASGGMTVRTRDGLTLPTDATDGPLSLASRTLSASDSYPATVPGIMLGGIDVTSRLTGGTLGANLQLRDTLIPTTQAELDSLASTVANRFSAQGVPLFTDASGAIPGASTTLSSPAGTVGFASQFQVNPSITAAPTTLLGSTSDAGQTLSDIAEGVFGTTAPDGTPLAAAPSTGLGPGGDLTAAYGGSGSLADLASNFVSSEGVRSSNAGTSLADETAVQTSLGSAISASTSVSIDGEMSKMVALQNSYAANAKIITAVQSMYTALLDAVTP